MLCCQDFVCLSTSSRTFRVDSTHTIYQLLTDSTGPNLVLSGNRNHTSMGDQGTRGDYWSSTAYSSATYAYSLYLISSGTVLPANYIPKYRGFSLRCLAVAPIRFAFTSSPLFSRKGKEEEGAVSSTPTTLTIPP